MGSPGSGFRVDRHPCALWILDSNRRNGADEEAMDAKHRVKIDLKPMLFTIVESLGCRTEPEFCQIDCGEQGIMVCIKLQAENIRNASGDLLTTSTFVGGTYPNHETAQTSAILAVFRHLEQNHFIKVLDFSSKVEESMDVATSFGYIAEAFAAVQQILSRLDITTAYVESFTEKLEDKQFSGLDFGCISAQGRICAGVSDFIIKTLRGIYPKIASCRGELTAIFPERAKLEKRMRDKLLSRAQMVSAPELVFNCKDLLVHMLSYIGAGSTYSQSNLPGDGLITSTVKINIPSLDDLKPPRNMEISCMASNRVLAEEEAAFKALVFIESHYNIRLLDYNYYRRLKVVELEQIIVALLASLIHLSEGIKNLWCDLDNSIKSHCELFTLDAGSIFPGPDTTGELESYNFCANGLQDIVRFSADMYSSCGDQFKLLNVLTWKLMEAKRKVHGY